jgi:hypothetical protein
MSWSVGRSGSTPLAVAVLVGACGAPAADVDHQSASEAARTVADSGDLVLDGDVLATTGTFAVALGCQYYSDLGEFSFTASPAGPSSLGLAQVHGTLAAVGEPFGPPDGAYAGEFELQESLADGRVVGHTGDLSGTLRTIGQGTVAAQVELDLVGGATDEVRLTLMGACNALLAG